MAASKRSTRIFADLLQLTCEPLRGGHGRAIGQLHVIRLTSYLRLGSGLNKLLRRALRSGVVPVARLQEPPSQFCVVIHAFAHEHNVGFGNTTNELGDHIGFEELLVDDLEGDVVVAARQVTSRLRNTQRLAYFTT
jgi:hypothetical protein